jgi:hypothetical protein
MILKHARRFFQDKKRTDMFLEQLLPLDWHHDLPDEGNQYFSEYSNEHGLYINHNTGIDRPIWIADLVNMIESVENRREEGNRALLTGTDTVVDMMLRLSGGKPEWRVHFPDKHEFIDVVAEKVMRELQKGHFSIENCRIFDLPVIIAEVPKCTISNLYLIDLDMISPEGYVLDIGSNAMIRDLM